MGLNQACIAIGHSKPQKLWYSPCFFLVVGGGCCGFVCVLCVCVHMVQLYKSCQTINKATLGIRLLLE